MSNNSSFDLRKNPVGRHFNVTQPINLEIQTFSITKRRTLSSLNVKFFEALISDETKTSEKLVIFDFKN